MEIYDHLWSQGWDPQSAFCGFQCGPVKGLELISRWFLVIALGLHWSHLETVVDSQGWDQKSVVCGPSPHMAPKYWTSSSEVQASTSEGQFKTPRHCGARNSNQLNISPTLEPHQGWTDNPTTLQSALIPGHWWDPVAGATSSPGLGSPYLLPAGETQVGSLF